MMCARWLRDAALFAVALGCSRTAGDAHSDSERTGSGPPNGLVAVTVQMPESLPAVLAHPVQWDAAKAIEALRGLGMQVTVSPVSVDSGIFSKGSRLAVRAGLDSAEVLVFVYGDALSAGRAIGRLASAADSSRTVMMSWRAPARLVTNNNLVAIVLSESNGLRARVVKRFQQSPLQ